MSEAYRTITVSPIAGALGAEISGVDLSQPLNQETWSEIHRAFLENLVILFRDQKLDPASFKTFAAHFGPLLEDPIVKSKDGEPLILSVTKEKHERKAFGETWHSDSTHWEKPPLASLLYAVEIPPTGGDTMFANQYMAYDALSPGLKATLGELRSVHRPDHYRKAFFEGAFDDRSMKMRDDEAARANVMKESVHPVIRTHPETSRKALFVNNSYTRYFEGWTEEESKPLFQWLMGHAVRPEFTCRFRWSPGAVAIRDNRCAMHHPINDYHGHRREMMRIVVEGDRPH